ncbi:phospholipase [Marinobacter salinus]|uniref:Phospholipase n=1 Tax=Marinobacter salinus TaxID=1874317 RepID=A0A1D9GJ37_9GAMM|nr:patatin-like phospholipase family protein [Marinobacter salinus]AOY87666.1 phospholipase [Marinobacter salinus]
MSRSKQLRRELEKHMAEADSYEHWYAAAEKLDELDGNLSWREEDGSDLLHETLIREHMDAMRKCRKQGDSRGLIRVLQESLYRHLGELANPDLYVVAWTGTKYLVSEFLDEVEHSMNFICDHDMPGVTAEQKLHLFRDAERVYGQPALMLSGGAAFGIYHIGVTRALWQQRLLPDVIAGSSMGAIVAGAICTRNEADLERFFNEPGEIQRDAFFWLEPARIWRKRHAMDQTKLLEHIRANIGSMSFREAEEISGRTLNISVSPTRTLQKPRLLTALSSPEVLVDSAILASCAVPGVYPPVTLQARFSEKGKNDAKPYMPSERWIDGSVHGDLPLMRMARLHNVNRTIVSQANPHVVPFISHHHQRGPGITAKKAVTSLMHAQLATALQLTRSASLSVVRPLLEQAYAMTTQTYLGDINIHFPFRPLLYPKLLANPSREDLDMFIRIGEQATWPRLPMIRDQTRISRTFSNCITRLKHACQGHRAGTE